MVSVMAVAIGVAVIVIGLLILRFFVKAAFTLVKIAILVVIGVAVWFGLEQVFGG